MTLESTLSNFRLQFVAGFFVCAGLLAYAIYVQFDLGIEPCPMCIFQRIAFMAMGVVFLIGAGHNPGALGRRRYALLIVLVACAGVGIAARHLWVQHQPPDPMGGCAPGWNYMVSNFPIGKALKMAFTGSADCSEISWTFFGLSMPFWTLLCYLGLGAGALFAGYRRRT